MYSMREKQNVLNVLNERKRENYSCMTAICKVNQRGIHLREIKNSSVVLQFTRRFMGKILKCKLSYMSML